MDYNNVNFVLAEDSENEYENVRSDIYVPHFSTRRNEENGYNNNRMRYQIPSLLNGFPRYRVSSFPNTTRFRRNTVFDINGSYRYDGGKYVNHERVREDWPDHFNNLRVTNSYRHVAQQSNWPTISDAKIWESGYESEEFGYLGVKRRHSIGESNSGGSRPEVIVLSDDSSDISKSSMINEPVGKNRILSSSDSECDSLYNGCERFGLINSSFDNESQLSDKTITDSDFEDSSLEEAINNIPEIDFNHNLQLLNQFTEEVIKLENDLQPCCVCGNSRKKCDIMPWESDIIGKIKTLTKIHDDEKCCRLQELTHAVEEMYPQKFDGCAIDVDGLTAVGIRICKDCQLNVQQLKLPKLSITKNYVGTANHIFEDMTFAEEMFVARNRIRCYVIRLKTINGKDGQIAYRGNVCSYDQQNKTAWQTSKILPYTQDNMAEQLLIHYVGPVKHVSKIKLPKCLYVRRAVVRRALTWLKKNNPLYKDIEVDEENVMSLPENDVCPFLLDNICSSNNAEITVRSSGSNVVHNNVFETEDYAIDSSGSIQTSNTLVYPHSKTKISEYREDYLAAAFPSLFPYGYCQRKGSSINVYAKYLISCSVYKRFKTHKTFVYVINNLFHRQQLSLVIRYQVKIPTRLRDDIGLILNPDESNSSKELLLRKIKTASENIKGSPFQKRLFRKQLHAMHEFYGPASFFVTINPADIHNELTRIFGGFKNVEMEYKDRNRLVKENPYAACSANHFIFEKVLDNLISPTDKPGILGKVDHYYGVVEAQSRGSLHLHLLIWVEGVKNPDENAELFESNEYYKTELVKYISSVIEESLPQKPEEMNVAGVHPCALNYFDFDNEEEIIAYTEKLTWATQIHRCNNSCKKYAKAMDPYRLCRFRFPKHVNPEDAFIDDNGHFVNFRNSSWVNNHNIFLQAAVRSNVDIQQVLVGTSAKALIYYATDYSTKNELRCDNLLSVIQPNLKLLMEDRSFNEGDKAYQARRIAIRAITSLAHYHEIPAQVAMSNVLDYPAKYTRDNFQFLNLCCFWTYYQPNLDHVLDNSDLLENAHNSNEEHDEEYLDSTETFEEELFHAEPTDTKFQLTNIRVDYEGRPSGLENVSLFEYVRHYTKYKGSPINREQVLADYHPQFGSHRITKRRNPVVPIIQGKTPNVKKLASVYKMLVLLHVPWRNFNAFYGSSYTSWKSILESSNISVESKKHIKNWLYHHNCMEERKSFDPNPSTNVVVSERPEELPDSFEAVPNFQESEDENIPDLDILSDELSNLIDIDIAEDTKIMTFDTNVELSSNECIFNSSHPILEGSVKLVHSSIRSFHNSNANNSTLETMLEDDNTETIGHDDYAVANPTLINVDEITVNNESYTLINDIRCSFGSLNDYVSKYHLNHLQKTAFFMAIEMLHSPQQALSYLGGVGGTGKSQVVHALMNYCQDNEYVGSVKLAAMTGKAACYIKGSTIHSTLGLSTNISASLASRPSDKIVEAFDHAKLLIIDEVSLVSARLLYVISTRLNQIKTVKDSSEIFGQISVLFIGDFYQLPPVGDIPIYGVPPEIHDTEAPEQRRKKEKRPGNLSERNAEIVAGMLIWKRIKWSVILTESMRARDDILYQQFLLELRRNSPNVEPFMEILESRCLKNIESIEDPTFIVTRHTLRHEIERAMLARYSESSHQSVAPAADSVNSGNLPINLQRYLDALPYNKTSSLPKYLYINFGKKYQIVQNINTKCGLVNGTVGVLVGYDQEKEIIYLQVDDYTGPIFPGCDEKVIPIIPVSKGITINETETVLGKRLAKIPIKRRQFPLVPAICITDYKSQGMTINSNTVIALPKHNSGSYKPNSLYVMFSRFKSFEQLHILNNQIPSSTFKYKWKENLVKEQKKLVEKSDQTVAYFTSKYNLD